MSRVLSAAVIGLLALSAAGPPARSDEKAKSIEGAWKQVETKNGDATEYKKSPDGVEMVDCIVGGRFIWTVTQQGKVAAVAGGRYAYSGAKFTETIDYVAGGGLPESFVGRKFEFDITWDGDGFRKAGLLKFDGQELKIDEKWERCKP